MELLRCEKLSKIYGRGEGQVTALDEKAHLQDAIDRIEAERNFRNQHSAVRAV